MKKSLVAICLAVVVACLMTSCNYPVGKHGELKSVSDVYGLGAVSTVKLLGGATSAAAVKTLAASVYEASADAGVSGSASDVNPHAEKFNEYFQALDSFLGDDIVSTTTESNPDAEYPYETKMTVKGKNFEGETETYIMYYTERLVSDTTEDGENEKQYSLVGTMVVNGADFYLSGGRSEESDKGEKESELKIRAYADVNGGGNYIEMEQEYSEETGETETEYVYSVYQNYALVEQTAVQFETERKNSGVETEYELKFIKGGARGAYTVEREEKNGVVQFKVKYLIDGKRGTFVISRQNSENGKNRYEYKFDDGSVLSF